MSKLGCCMMNLKVDIYSCEGCGRAIFVEENEDAVICPYKDCGDDHIEFSHSGEIHNS